MKRSKYVIVTIIGLMIGICTNLAHPVTPYLVKTMGWPEISFSIFFSSMSLGMLIFAPIWGSFGDKYGKKLVFLICSIGYSLGQIMFGLFDNLYLVIFARFFSGIFSGGLNVALVSYLSSSKDLKDFDKTRLIPWVLSFQLVGNSFGSFLGGLMGDYFSKLNLVLYAQALILTTCGIIMFFLFRLDDEDLSFKANKKSFIYNLKNVKNIGFWNVIFLICLTLFSIVFTNATRYLDYYYSDIGRTTSELGLLNLTIGLSTLFCNVLITPFILKRLKPVLSIILAGVIGSATLFITFMFKNEALLYMIYSTFLVFMATKAIIESASVTYISRESENKGVILGVRQSFYSLGAVIGPILGGLIYYNYEIENRNRLFFICAFVCIISTLILSFMFIIKRRRS